MTFNGAIHTLRVNNRFATRTLLSQLLAPVARRADTGRGARRFSAKSEKGKWAIINIGLDSAVSTYSR